MRGVVPKVELQRIGVVAQSILGGCLAFFVGMRCNTPSKSGNLKTFGNRFKTKGGLVRRLSWSAKHPSNPITALTWFDIELGPVTEKWVLKSTAHMPDLHVSAP